MPRDLVRDRRDLAQALRELGERYLRLADTLDGTTSRPETWVLAALTDAQIVARDAVALSVRMESTE